MTIAGVAAVCGSARAAVDRGAVSSPVRRRAHHGGQRRRQRCSQPMCHGSIRRAIHRLPGAREGAGAAPALGADSRLGRRFVRAPRGHCHLDCGPDHTHRCIDSGALRATITVPKFSVRSRPASTRLWAEVEVPDDSPALIGVRDRPGHQRDRCPDRADRGTSHRGIHRPPPPGGEAGAVWSLYGDHLDKLDPGHRRAIVASRGAASRRRRLRRQMTMASGSSTTRNAAVWDSDRSTSLAQRRE